MRTFERVICIPACNEFDYLPKTIRSVGQLSFNTLLIVSINCRSNSSQAVMDDNTKLLHWLLQHPHRQKQQEYWVQCPQATVLVLDHTSEGNRFSPKQGVGTARKRLASRAIELIEEGIVSCPWIWCSDGDARFQKDYLDLPPLEKGVCITPYRHFPAPKELLIYEATLRYYTLGLHWASSPYAFPTIGSTIAIHKDTYQTIHGFSDRQAAEDFYLLNKAAKVAPVYYRSTAPIVLEGRPSDRVPFGTGRAMKDIADQPQIHRVYAPSVFARLRQWLNILRSSPDDQLLSNLRSIVPDYPSFRKWEKLLRQPSNPKTRIRRRFELFDAFHTMRFIHHLRDLDHPSIPYPQAFAAAPFLPDNVPQDLNDLQQCLFEWEHQRVCGSFYGLSSTKNPWEQSHGDDESSEK